MKREAQPNLINDVNLEDEILVVEESKGKRIMNAIVNGILVLAIALAAVCTYISFVSTSGNGVPSLFGIRVFSIQTESMYPTLLPGDLIFDTGVKEPEELSVGDVITYWTVINGERVLNTHRIHEIYDGGGYLIYATKGDNNTIADPLTVHESEVVGKYSFRVPGLGKVFDYLQTSTGFLIVIVIPVFLFFLFHLIQFFRVLFAYQNVKNRIKYEQERGTAEDLIEKQKQQEAEAKAKMEAEMRERLRAELLASMKQPEAAEAAAPVVEEVASVPEEVAAAPAAEEVVSEPVKEEVSAPAEEPAPAEESTPAHAVTVMDEAAIEALIAKQREAIEAELREKLLAEMKGTVSQTKAEE